ncbi:hypothetical protein OAQ99_05665 [Candidatus Kapabacteria bacterium]|nr:hypothetical protein [Candidatus Kapabacteria bacterium]
MEFSFTSLEINKISEALNCEVKSFAEGYSWNLNNKESGQSLLCNLYIKAQLGDQIEGVLVSVQTQHGYFELHDCNSFMVFEPDEIIFLQSTETKVSSLIIGKNASCSLYSNINREILGADFGALDPAVLLSAMQLSLTEGVLPE